MDPATTRDADESAGLLSLLGDDPILGPLAVRVLAIATKCDQVVDLLAEVLPPTREVLVADWLGVVAGVAGTFDVLGQVGGEMRIPMDLVAETLDSEQAAADGPWAAAPLNARARSGEVLLARGEGAVDEAALARLADVARLIGEATGSVGSRYSDQRRIRRLEAILKITGQWNQTREMEPLLVQMAEAATRLLRADRASIFLWDRPNKTLVGRPALGVEGGELRIADDTGIVGQVVHTGESRRVGRAGGAEIDRSVGEKVGYQTENLLCVPLRGGEGELFGAFEVINKLDGDFTDDDVRGLEELASHAAIALENTQNREQLLVAHRQMVQQAAEGVQLVGQSAAIEALRGTVGRVADTELAILILGENGTGKEVVSRMVHYLSRRRDQPFIAVNCAAITETLLESELFGHEKGAFTDAHEARQGKFELASGGTLFLDEIGDLSLGGQAKLLRVLEEKIVVRVGGSTPIHTDARVIAATNQDLTRMVGEKKFREDLYYRLNVVTLDLPPLRDRGDDALLLAEHFLADFCTKSHRKPLTITAAAQKRLLGHRWPGNVRELRNLMERLAYLSQSDQVNADDLAFILSPSDASCTSVAGDLPLTEATTRFQVDHIQGAIRLARGNMSDAAARLGLHRSNLYRKMRQLGMGDGE